jgi:L-ascorbate metabolism protein UlaG (beta-lactamase superfamily)
MRRFLPVLIPLLLVAQARAADPAPDSLSIRWHGQSFFDITTLKGTKIVLDPHFISNFGRTELKADLVLMSHLHSDHTQTDAITNIRELPPEQIVKALKGDPTGRTEWNRIEGRTFKDVKFSTVGTYHDSNGGMTRGRNGIFIMDVDGLRIVHLGDLGHVLSDKQVRALGDVDILMIPVGGVYTLNGLDAAKVVEQIKPRRYIIPMHYGTAVYGDLLDNKVFLKEIEEMKNATIRIYTGNELKVDPKAKVPEKPEVAVLHWN